MEDVDRKKEKRSFRVFGWLLVAIYLWRSRKWPATARSFSPRHSIRGQQPPQLIQSPNPTPSNPPPLLPPVFQIRQKM